MTTLSPEDRALKIARQFVPLELLDGQVVKAIAQAIRSAEAEAVEMCALIVEALYDVPTTQWRGSNSEDAYQTFRPPTRGEYAIAIRSLTAKEGR